VIGSAGTKEKCDWLTQLGYDHVFNYKQTTVDEALHKLAPNGIDLYFDNVSKFLC
jgi:NADPH-dependent curcumin reductase CurA